MKRKKEVKSKTLAVYVTPTELTALKEEFQTTTHHVFAEFIRARLRQAPIVKKFRNQSLDDLHHALINIKTELETAGHSFSEAVRKLKAQPQPDRQTLEYLLSEQFTLRETVRSAQAKLIQLYEQCSQEQSPSQK